MADKINPRDKLTNQGGSETSPEAPGTGMRESERESSMAVRRRDFVFLPIPKSKRHDPTLKAHEQFMFTWKINLVLAGAAVSQ